MLVALRRAPAATWHQALYQLMTDEVDELPIAACLESLIAATSQATPVVLKAPPGAGKTTGVPPAILAADAAGGGKVLLIQPRRLAARASASRLASIQGCKLGSDVGYHVRFEKRVGKQTRLIAMTTGMLLRRLQADPLLEDVSCVVLDEFHERSLEIDLALGMLHRIRTTLRPELRLIVMSATLDPDPIVKFLGDGISIVSEGRSFPVAVHHTDSVSHDRIEEQITRTLPQVLDETSGHVLVFLPGVGEIHRTQQSIAATGWGKSLQTHALYGDLPANKQDAVLRPGGSRKVILSTNVAETSVTIPGVTGVIDSGLVRMMNVDPRVGLPKLVLQPISKASAEQRAGRAGRTEPGVCHRLWPLAVHRARREQDLPEIARGDLATATLMLAAWGERDALEFPWLTLPSESAVQHAHRLLRRLSAIDTSGNITALGRRMVAMPIHPRLARFMLEANERDIRREASLAVAVMTERDPLRGLPGQQRSTGSHRCDVSEKVDRLKTILNDRSSPHRHLPAIQNAKRVSEQLERLLEGTNTDSNAKDDSQESPKRAPDTEEAMRHALLTAFPDRLARRREEDRARGRMVGGRGVRQSKRSAAREDDLFLCIEIDSQGSEASVHTASAVEESWLDPKLIRLCDEASFQPSTKSVVARRCTYFEDLLLRETPIECLPNSETAELLAKYARENLDQCFPQSKATREFIERVRFLSQAAPDLPLPPLQDQAVDEVLQELCRTRTSFEQLANAPWLDHLRGRYDYEQLQTIERYAPAKITVPSGNSLPIHYTEGKRPRLEVRIQEIFGWSQTPRLAKSVPLQLHLLGPNYRPQQITDDLENFWSETYAHVRKELRRRYPKHHWPEDPASAIATRNGLKPKR
ncbi:MAG: ATP-dependent helicase HrpB [Rubripirellula sp.]